MLYSINKAINICFLTLPYRYDGPFIVYFSDFLLGDMGRPGSKGSRGLLGRPGTRGENGEKGGWQEEEIITFLFYNRLSNIPPCYYKRDKITLTVHVSFVFLVGQVRRVRCAFLVKLFLVLLAPQENQEGQVNLDWQVKELLLI